jgi:integrase/recombinase XerD
VPFNVGAPFQTPAAPVALADRIASEEAVLKVIYGEHNPRNAVFLRVLYFAGLRVSEACGLRWRDLQPAADGAGQITVFGKGGKTRVVLVSAAVWDALQKLRGTAGPDAAVFRSRTRGGHLNVSQARRIVYAGANRAGLDLNLSPHWFRHAHASLALDRGAPIHLVQQTLGHSSVDTTGRYQHARPKDSSGRFLPAA